MKILVGLGNPGSRYAETPHNAGFKVVDELAGRLVCRLKRSFRHKARMGKVFRRGEWIWLVQPQTYMNRSGWSVADILRRQGAELEDLLVILDDADLPMGRIRIRPSGSAGGHRGLESVIQSTGSREFARLRIGVGRADGRNLVDHVLSRFSPDEAVKMQRVAEVAAEAALQIVDFGVQTAMNAYNGLDIE